MNREELNKLFDEHFIDDCSEVYDAQNEIVDFTEKAVKLFAISDVRKSLIDFANFIGDRPLPEYSKSINKWRWWDNNLRDYKTASTEELLSEWEKSINVS